MSARIETLKSLIAQDPANSRLRYMLAMETLNSGDAEAAVRVFTEMLELDPSYAAGYFHGGQALEKMGRAEEARDFYRRGIAVTSASGDSHAQSELQAALDLLGG